MTVEVHVIGLGMVTSVGIRSTLVTAAVRAGVTRFCESEFYDYRGEYLICAPLHDHKLTRLSHRVPTPLARPSQLANMALSEVLPQLPDNVKNIPVLLGTAEDHPKWSAPLTRSSLATAFGATPLTSYTTPAQCELFPNGRASGLQAIARGVELIESGAHKLVIVGGVDSYIDPSRLQALDNEHRVRCAGVMDGFTPGEGAGFLLLAAKGSVTSARVLARITGWGVGKEAGHRYSEEPFLGDGLSHTLQKAVHNVPQIHTIYAGMNGESMFFKEWGVSQIRLGPTLAKNAKLVHPADCIGDTGAAHGPIMAGCAIVGFQRNYVRSPALVFCSSDGPIRAAIVLEPVAQSAESV